MHSITTPDVPREKGAGVLHAKRSKNTLPTVVIAGNPNCGKTSIFNALTGSRYHVANWPGVTVEKRYGSFHFEQTKIQVVDLPGTYSLLAQSEDERIAASFLEKSESNVIVNVLDASNLERNLYLTTQLLEMKKPMVFVLNMIDDSKRLGITIDVKRLQNLLGGQVITTVGNRGNGINALKLAIFNAAGKSATLPTAISYGNDIETELTKLEEDLYRSNTVTTKCPNRWLALGLLEQATCTEVVHNGTAISTQQTTSVKLLEERLGIDVPTLIAERRYKFASDLAKKVFKQHYENKQGWVTRLDGLLTHKWLGIPILMMIIAAMYGLAFQLGQYPQKWIAKILSLISNPIIARMPEGELASLLTDGIIPGVETVITFLPIIMILMGCVSFLEDTGYMSRAAFIMDRPMHFMGLHGKSFIPLIMGTGCNVPAVQATRTIEAKSDRLITILVAPLISCSARLQVYVLIAGTFFSPTQAIWAIIALHLIGFSLVMVMGKVLRTTIFRTEASPFVMELPPYRMPVLTSTIIQMWEKGRLFLAKSGTAILIGTILIWSLSHYPGIANKELHTKHEADKRAIYCQKLTPIKEQERIYAIKLAFENDIMNASLAAYMGQKIQPILAPILDPGHKNPGAWKEGVALIAGFVAKETVISTIGVTNQIKATREACGNDLSSLQNALKQNSGLTPLTAFAFMVFIMLYTPCIGMLGMIMKETKSFAWTMFSVAYGLVLAWFASWTTVFIGHIFGIT